MPRCEQAYNALWIVLGLGICLLSVRLTLWDESGPGNGFIPFVAGLLIGISGLGLLLAEWARRPAAAALPFLPNRPATVRILLILGGLCFMAASLTTLGFLLSAFLSLCFLLRAIEPQKWWVVVLVALISCAGGYGLFNTLLQVPLPRGLLGL